MNDEIENEGVAETPFQRWANLKGKERIPYDIIVISKDGEAALDRLVVDYGAVPAVFIPEKQLIFYEITGGKFVLVSTIWEGFHDAIPFVDIWNWWTEGAVDLKSFREKAQLDRLILENSMN